MQETIHLSDLWERTITKIFKHDPESKLGTDEDFKPHSGGSLSYYEENGNSVVKMISCTPLQELINLRWYIQHLIPESGYLYDDDESNYPMSEV